MPRGWWGTTREGLDGVAQAAGNPWGLPAGPRALWPGRVSACCSVWVKVMDASKTNHPGNFINLLGTSQQETSLSSF